MEKQYGSNNGHSKWTHPVCLNEHRFLSLEDAKEKVEAWRGRYNAPRPHSSLGYQSRMEYLSGALLPTPRSLRLWENLDGQETAKQSP